MEWVIRKIRTRDVGLKYMFYIGYEQTHLFDLVGPEMNVLPLVILMVYLLSWDCLELFWIPTEEIQLGMYPLKVYLVYEDHSRFSSVVMSQKVSKGMLSYCCQPWNLILHSRICVLIIIPLGCRRRSRKINFNCT